MCKHSEKYPSLHKIERCEVLLVTVAEGKGTPDDPVYELTYVCRVIDGDYVAIGELYDAKDSLS